MKTRIIFASMTLLTLSLSSCSSYSGYNTPKEVIEKSMTLFESVLEGDYTTFTSHMLPSETIIFGSTDEIHISSNAKRKKFFKRITDHYASRKKESGAELVLTHLLISRSHNRNVIDFVFTDGTTTFSWHAMQWYEHADAYYFEIMDDDFGKHAPDIEQLEENLEKFEKMKEENPVDYQDTWKELIEI